MEEAVTSTIDITSAEARLLRFVLEDFETKTGDRKTPPKGWTYAQVVDALRLSAGIRLKFE